MTEQTYRDRSRTTEDLILDQLQRLELRQIEQHGSLQREIIFATFAITAFVFLAAMVILAKQA